MTITEPPEKVSRECLETVQDAIDDLRSERTEFESFVDQILDELEATRLDLVAQAATAAATEV